MRRVPLLLLAARRVTIKTSPFARPAIRRVLFSATWRRGPAKYIGGYVKYFTLQPLSYDRIPLLVGDFLEVIGNWCARRIFRPLGAGIAGAPAGV
jgi:hypothetical protein